MAEKVRVQLLLDKELVDAVDALVAEIDGNRTAFIAICVEDGLQDLEFLRKFGVTARRLKKIATVLQKLGFLETSEEGGWGGVPAAGVKAPQTKADARR